MTLRGSQRNVQEWLPLDDECHQNYENSKDGAHCEMTSKLGRKVAG